MSWLYPALLPLQNNNYAHVVIISQKFSTKSVCVCVGGGGSIHV